MIEKRIGKIKSISFGFGGYDDAMLGISVTLGSEKDCWGVGDFKGAWTGDPMAGAKWTVESRAMEWGKIVEWLGRLLSDAKASKIEDLKGAPVEVTFDNYLLKEWRILTEVV